jgi:hypothetical protein
MWEHAFPLSSWFLFPVSFAVVYETFNYSFPAFVSLPAQHPLSLRLLIDAHRQAFDLRREHAPGTVAVTEEEQTNRACG